jgi:S1-C subfamily serine protease
VGNIRPGDSAVFTIVRDGTAKDFNVRIEARSDETASESSKLWPGLAVLVLNDELRTSLRLEKDAQGLYVAQVIAESPAAVLGLQRGDRILAINDIPVKDLPSFYKVLRENTDKELWFTHIRGSNTLDTQKIRR